MDTRELLSALEPLVPRSQGKMTVNTDGLRVLTRSLIADATAPHLYQMVKAITLVIMAVAEMRGGEPATLPTSMRAK
jgi:hypothetical protein